MLFTIVISRTLTTTGGTFGTTATTDTGTMFTLLTTNSRRNQFRAAVNDSTANPNLNTDTSISRVSLSISVINVSTESVQRSTTFFKMLATSNLSTTNTTANRNLDAFGTGTHGCSNGVLNSTTVLNTTLNLFGDILSNKNSIHLRMFYFTDVDLNILARQFLKLFTQFVDLRTGTTNNQTRTGCIDRNSEHLKRALNVNLRNTSLSKTGIEVLANLIVLNKFLFELSTAEPVGIPSADDT